jgi:hypothetical protein
VERLAQRLIATVRVVGLVIAAGLLMSMTTCDLDETASLDLSVVRSTVWSGHARPLQETTATLQYQVDSAPGLLIDTDLLGEAELRGRYGGHTCNVFIYRESRLQTYKCSRAQRHNESCVATGDFFYELCRSHVVITDVAEIRVEGTRFAVSSDPSRQVTLVIVLDGHVRAFPVVDVGSGRLGPGVAVPAGTFWFTTPDGRRIGLLEGRRAHPLHLIGDVIRELGLEAFVERVRARGYDLMPPPTSPPTSPPASPPSVGVEPIPRADVVTGRQTPSDPAPALLVDAGGGPLEDPRVAEALLLAVPWVRLPVVPQSVAVAGRSFDPRRQGYDPERARALLAEAGHPSGFEVALLLPSGWAPPMRDVAGALASHLATLGLQPFEVEVLPHDEFLVARMRLAGGAVIVLTEP